MSRRVKDECLHLTEGGCRCEVNVKGGVATLTSLDKAVSGAYEVPRTVGGYPVTAIARRAFDRVGCLSSVLIPESVVDIEDLAFSNCHELAAIRVDERNPCYSGVDGVLFDKDRRRLIRCPPQCVKVQYEVPAGVTEIAEEAFLHCSELAGVTLPQGLIRIGTRAFHWCSKISALDIPDSVTEIGDEAFTNSRISLAIRVCDGNDHFCVEDGVLFDKVLMSLKYIPENRSGEYTIPAGVREIECSALMSCYRLTAIQVEAGSESFASIDGVLFFKEMDELLFFPRAKTGICRVPASVTTIDSKAYSGCSGLTGFEVEEGNAHFRSEDGRLFCTDNGELLFSPPANNGVCNVPAGVTNIDFDVLNGASGFRIFEVDELNWCFRSVDGVLYSRDMVELIRCPKLWAGYVQVPEGVEQVRCFAFSACSQLTGIRFPASVKDIDHLFFVDEGCTSLTAIDVDEDNRTYRSVDGVLFTKDLSELICCPAGRAGTYTIPATVKSIDDFAFIGCGKLERIEVPKSVENESGDVWNWVKGKVVHEE